MHFAKLLRAELCLSHEQLLGSSIPASLLKEKIYRDPEGPGVTHRAGRSTRAVRIKLHVLGPAQRMLKGLNSLFSFKAKHRVLDLFQHVFVVFPKQALLGKVALKQ